MIQVHGNRRPLTARSFRESKRQAWLSESKGLPRCAAHSAPASTDFARQSFLVDSPLDTRCDAKCAAVVNPCCLFSDRRRLIRMIVESPQMRLSCSAVSQTLQRWLWPSVVTLFFLGRAQPTFSQLPKVCFKVYGSCKRIQHCGGVCTPFARQRRSGASPML